MEQEQINLSKKKTFFERYNTSLKGIVVAFLLLCMLIPRQKIVDLIYEREYFRNQAIDEVSNKWSYEQNVMGPVVSVPYIKFWKIWEKRAAKFLDDTSKKKQKVEQ